jgi:hypothetical protein
MEYSSVQEAKVALNKFDGAMTKGKLYSILACPQSKLIIQAKQSLSDSYLQSIPVLHPVWPKEETSELPVLLYTLKNRVVLLC